MSKRAGSKLNHIPRPFHAIADFYDYENAHHPMLREDVPFFLGHLPKKSKSILELCAGTGRVAIPLAQAGHRVVGVDLFADMIEIARRKRDAVGLSDRELQLITADATKVNLRRRFDWVCILFNTLLNFGTIEMMDALLQNVRRHLAPAGRFYFDIFQPDLTRLTLEHRKHVEPNAFFVPELRLTVYRETEVRHDPTRQMLHIKFHYRWFEADGREKKSSRAFDITYLFPRELRLILERNGLELERLYGDYHGSDVAINSPRMIGIARLG